MKTLMLISALVLGVGWVPASLGAEDKTIELTLQTRDPQTGALQVQARRVDPRKVAIIVVDSWNWHWCMTAAERFNAMAPRMNQALAGARQLGLRVLWCPTDVTGLYVGWPQRERALGVPYVPVPKVRDLNLRINVPVGACMCGPGLPCQVNYGWDGMNPALVIAAEDFIPCGREETYSLLKSLGIEFIIYLGGHTNMCLIGKPDALVNMYRAGFDCAVGRDLNDAFTSYDPATGWTPDTGTAKTVSDIEASGVPTINLVEEVQKAGAWNPDWVVEKVRVTPWGTEQRPYQFTGTVIVTLTLPLLKDAEIRHTLDGGEPGPTSPRYEKPLALNSTTWVRAAAYRDGRRVSLESRGYFVKLPSLPPAPEVYVDALPQISRQYSNSDFFWLPVASQSFEHKSLRIRGKTYAHGLGMRAPANALYAVKPEYTRFVALAGIDDHLIANNGIFLAQYPSVTFKVFIDGQLAAESPVLRISQEPWRFDVPIPAGSRQINLVAGDAGSRHPLDLANWVEAGFILKASPPAGRDRSHPDPD